MKALDHVRKLLEGGHKPKELVELGFSKAVITRVKRQLKRVESEQKPRVPTKTAPTESQVKILKASPADITGLQQELATLECKIQELEGRLDGTPALGLKHRFTCSCGVSGLVALHIQCTKCERETWYGWFPD